MQLPLTVLGMCPETVVAEVNICFICLDIRSRKKSVIELRVFIHSKEAQMESRLSFKRNGQYWITGSIVKAIDSGEVTKPQQISVDL